MTTTAERPLTIGEVSEQLGRSVDTLRRYERNGLIPPARRDLNGRRYYTVEDVQRIRAILWPSNAA